jgi:hypothetical protein
MFENYNYSDQLTIVSATKIADHHVVLKGLIEELDITEFSVKFINNHSNKISERNMFGISDKKLIEEMLAKRYTSNNTSSNYVTLSSKAILSDGYMILPSTFGHWLSARKLSEAKRFFQAILTNRFSTTFNNDLDQVEQKKGYIQYVERNGWELETWYFFIPLYNNTKHIDLITKFAERINQVKFTSMGYASYFKLNLANIYPEDYVFDIVNNSNAGGYMSKWNVCNDKLNIKLIKKIINSTDNEIIDILYKGGINKLFSE